MRVIYASQRIEFTTGYRIDVALSLIHISMCIRDRLIARFNPEDINPQGQTMATAALIHKDTEVQECAIRAFESWASIDVYKRQELDYSGGRNG